MQDDGSDVAMSRWLYRAATGAIGQTTAAVCVFAGRYGSRPPTLKCVTAAVTEALDEIFGADSASSPDTVVEAAADSEWLTVRLQGPGRWPADATETRLRDLADNVELSYDERSATMTVLFEFPADPDRTDTRSIGGAIVPCRAGRRRRRASGRRAARRMPRLR